jgi:hypothetical protein
MFLMQARDLIKDPEHWCQGHEAETADGATARACSPEADRWCALGALIKASSEKNDAWRRDWNAILAGLSQAARELGARRPVVLQDKISVRMITRVNDFTSHAVVMRMFEMAINNALTVPAKPA